MIPTASSSLLAGDVTAVITQGQRRPEQWARIAASKMIQVADTAPPAIRDQARAFKDSLTRVMANYIRMALEEDRAFLATQLEREGHAGLAPFVRSR